MASLQVCGSVVIVLPDILGYDSVSYDICNSFRLGATFKSLYILVNRLIVIFKCHIDSLGSCKYYKETIMKVVSFM